MIELKREERQAVASVCRDSQEVLVLGAIERGIGQVWAAALENPSYCLILVGDFVYLLGIPPHGKAALELKLKMYEICKQAMITAADQRWAHWIEEQFSCDYRKITRYALKKHENHFNRVVLQAYIDRLPKEYELKQINKSLYRLALSEDWSHDFCSNFDDADHFVRDGLGFVVVKGDQIVSGCSAYGVSNHKLEVEVITKKAFRRQGLALSCSASFILECLNRGIYPNWDAANQRSVALAEKLGYIFDYEYEVYQLLEIAE